jgi:hypothetical protein
LVPRYVFCDVTRRLREYVVSVVWRAANPPDSQREMTRLVGRPVFR